MAPPAHEISRYPFTVINNIRALSTGKSNWRIITASSRPTLHIQTALMSP
jgi:hypothetical protein